MYFRSRPRPPEELYVDGDSDRELDTKGTTSGATTVFNVAITVTVNT